MLKVLLVEDDRINRLVVKKMLEMKNIDVTSAADGYEAVEIYKKDNDFNIVIMDIQLPGMDGIETAKKIRENQEASGRNVPIIALTAYAGEENIKYFLSEGFDDCAQKPVDYGLLLELIKKHTS